MKLDLLIFPVCHQSKLLILKVADDEMSVISAPILN